MFDPNGAEQSDEHPEREDNETTEDSPQLDRSSARASVWVNEMFTIWVSVDKPRLSR
jgi:hypothetical protein